MHTIGYTGNSTSLTDVTCGFGIAADQTTQATLYERPIHSFGCVG